MAKLFYTSPEHKRRWLTAMLATGKVWEGKLDPEYGAALYILTASDGTWQKAQSFVSRDGIRIEAMIHAEDFSSGYLALVRLAANLFNDANEEGQKARPVDLMILDDHNFAVALTALQIRRVNWPLSELATEAEINQIKTDIHHTKEWWEESPEEFVAGFSEETQVHHNEGPAIIHQNSPDALAALYGPAAAHSEYSRFTRVRYRDGGRTKQGLIIWVTEATKDSPMLYVIEQDGFPDWVAGSDIIGLVE